MKKKFLVPIMALAMVVTAGVNYNLIGEQMNSLKSNLADICSVSTAQAEWEFDSSNFVSSVWDQLYLAGYNSYGDPYYRYRTICEGQGWLYCPIDGISPY